MRSNQLTPGRIAAFIRDTLAKRVDEMTELNRYADSLIGKSTCSGITHQTESARNAETLHGVTHG